MVFGDKKIVANKQDNNCKFLSYTSGVQVSWKLIDGKFHYTFRLDEKGALNLKTVVNYKKARIFAEGVKIGKLLSNI